MTSSCSWRKRFTCQAVQEPLVIFYCKFLWARKKIQFPRSSSVIIADNQKYWRALVLCIYLYNYLLFVAQIVWDWQPSEIKRPNLICFLSFYMAIPWRHYIEIIFTLLAHCEGNPPLIGGFLHKDPIMRAFAVYFLVNLNKLLNNSWVDTDLDKDSFDFHKKQSLQG